VVFRSVDGVQESDEMVEDDSALTGEVFSRPGLKEAESSYRMLDTTSRCSS